MLQSERDQLERKYKEKFEDDNEVSLFKLHQTTIVSIKITDILRKILIGRKNIWQTI